MKPQTTQSVVLLSGGLDSTVCLHITKQQRHHVSGIFIDFGQAARIKEAEASRSIADFYGIDLQVISITTGREYPNGEVMGRNAFLVLTALVSSRIAAGSLVLGIHQGTQYYDCSPAFANSLNLLLSEHSDGTVRLSTPLLYWNKSEILEYCKGKEVPIEKTYSCERGTQPTCGECKSCLDRQNINARTETLS